MRVLQLLIDRDAVQKTACEKWAADLLILRAMYGDDERVTVLGYRDVEDDRSPQEEYERLRKTYGNRPESNVPWVEYIYGRSMDSLAKAMEGEGVLDPMLDADVKEAAKAPTTSTPATKKTKKAAGKTAE